MLNARLTCPACGQQAGVPIFFGMPPPEVVEQVESGQLDVVLGGCCVPDPMVNAACRSCDHRWLVADQKGEVIDAHVGGGPWGPRYSIRSDGQQVAWEGTEGDSTTIATVDPGPEAWAQFWAAVDGAGAWAWAPRYDDADVMDGTSWAVRLEYDGRAVEATGSNAYPPGWKKVQAALEQLAGRSWR